VFESFKYTPQREREERRERQRERALTVTYPRSGPHAADVPGPALPNLEPDLVLGGRSVGGPRMTLAQ